jgi:hypothetical protein
MMIVGDPSLGVGAVIIGPAAPRMTIVGEPMITALTPKLDDYSADP